MNIVFRGLTHLEYLNFWVVQPSELLKKAMRYIFNYYVDLEASSRRITQSVKFAPQHVVTNHLAVIPMPSAVPSAHASVTIIMIASCENENGNDLRQVRLKFLVQRRPDYMTSGRA